MRIYVMNHGGRRMEFDVDSDDTVEMLMGQIQEADGIPLTYQRLVFAGKELRSVTESLGSYNITHGTTLYLVLGSTS